MFLNDYYRFSNSFRVFVGVVALVFWVERKKTKQQNRPKMIVSQASNSKTGSLAGISRPTSSFKALS